MKGKRVEVGPLAIDRMVAQRYEWRDAQLQTRKRTRAGTQQTRQTSARTERRKRVGEDGSAARTHKTRRKDPG